jgi:hypothetical protein
MLFSIETPSVTGMVSFQVLTATNMKSMGATPQKSADFWDVAPCSLVDTDRHFRGAYYLHYLSDRSSETRVSFYLTARRNIPEDSRLQFRPAPAS